MITWMKYPKRVNFRCSIQNNQALSEIDKKKIAILDVKLDKGDNDGINYYHILNLKQMFQL